MLLQLENVQSARGLRPQLLRSMMPSRVLDRYINLKSPRSDVTCNLLIAKRQANEVLVAVLPGVASGASWHYFLAVLQDITQFDMHSPDAVNISPPLQAVHLLPCSFHSHL